MKSITVQARSAAAILALVVTSCHETTAPPIPTQLAFIVSPAVTPVGGTLAPVVQVGIQDALGNTVRGATNAVSVTLGNNPAGATLSGTTTVSAVNGVATFGDLSIDKPGVGYTLTVTSSDLASASSASFSITGPAKLAFVVQPGVTTAGTAMIPAVQVAIQDALGNTVTSATNTVSVTLGNNPAGGTLSGITTVSAVNGVAMFGGLSIDKPSAGYTLTATSGDLTASSSAPFTIIAGPSPPTALHITTTTTGTSPSNYFLSVDCDSYGCGYTGQISPNGAVTVPVASGDHFVSLSVPDNCIVSGDAQRTVTATGPTEVLFAITCAATGSLSVTTTTSGTDINPDNYSVCVDRSGAACYWHAQVRANDAVTITGIISGPHTVTLTNVGGNCAVSGGATRAVTIPANGSASAPFSVTCSLAERIAFSSIGTINVVHADGTAARVIAQGLAPAWSPDGARLAYECAPNICTINADGTGFTQVTSGGATNRHPTWSPDGLKIAFASSASGTTDLYAVTASGGAAVRLTQGVGFVGNPAWSPDGTRIAFDCQVDAGNSDICVVHADGTGFARLTSDPASDYGAAWKPDGSTLAFATTRFGFDEIVLMSSTGGSVTRIGAGLPGFAPTWSPDGTQLAFVQLFNDPYFGPYETILTAHVDGSNSRTVIRGAQPAWKPHP